MDSEILYLWPLICEACVFISIILYIHSMSQQYKMPFRTRIGHVHLKVSDLERSLDFYCGLLGFKLMQTFGEQAAFILGFQKPSTWMIPTKMVWNSIGTGRVSNGLLMKTDHYKCISGAPAIPAKANILVIILRFVQFNPLQSFPDCNEYNIPHRNQNRILGPLMGY